VEDHVAVRLARHLTDDGYGTAEVRRLVLSGELHPVRRGAYAMTPGVDAAERHHQLVAATLPMLSPDACLSHISAAVLHRLPVWPDLLDRVHGIRSRPGGGRRGSVVHVHPAYLEPYEVTAMGSMRLTSLARTVSDCARTVSYSRAVAMGDAALRIGMDRELLLDSLDRTRGCIGAAGARRAAAFLHPGAESVGESFSRVVLHAAGLQAPGLQLEIPDAAGVIVARVDFAGEERRTVGEFDGKVKYGQLLKPGETAGDAIYREKLREDMLRDLGWQVVRWTWDDLARPDLLADRLRRAFARGVRR
jgi:hypothetical protein